MQTFSDTSNTILSQLKIEEVVGKFVDLKRRGTNFIGLCPFHDEKTPSFVVSDSKQIYKCFGCGKSGNAISFIMEIKKWSFAEAISYISHLYNITTPSKTPIQEQNNYELKEYSILKTVLSPIKVNFNSNVQSIQELLNFDKFLLEFCILQIEDLDQRIRSNEEIVLTNVRFFPTTTLTHLRNIRKNNSFKFKYDTINNQSLVLLISYFTSSLKEIFKGSLDYLAQNKREFLKSVETDFKISLQELGEYDFNLTKAIGDIIIRKKDISFQDMQSTVREFKNYLGIDIIKTEMVDNIIFAQASRHSIVHSLGVADAKFISQIAKTERTLKPDISINDEIIFSSAEIEEVILNLKSFIDNLMNQISLKFD